MTLVIDLDHKLRGTKAGDELYSSVLQRRNESVLFANAEVFQDQNILELAIHRAELMLEHNVIDDESLLLAEMVATTQRLHQSLL